MLMCLICDNHGIKWNIQHRLPICARGEPWYY
uniref:Uncharacterized protein n=1 Tax=Arundo donax TaxID=35708 RepID=A0A0A8Z3K8_ARUDO